MRAATTCRRARCCPMSSRLTSCRTAAWNGASTRRASAASASPSPHVNRDDSCIRYILQKNGDPMHELDGTADMIFSQAALEHVGELSLAYERMSRWLVPGGFVSHQIDFQCHGAARDWNGHWAYSDPVWKLVYLGTEPLINRVPCSEHLRLMRHHGFESVAETRRQDVSGIAEPMLATRFRGMSADDLTTRGVFVQAVMRRRQQNGPELSS